MIEIYLVDTSSIKDEEFDKYYNVVRKERQIKIDRYKRYEDKKLSLAVGIALKNALQNNNVDYFNATFCVTDKGKVYLENNKDDLHFNVSHSGKYAVAVISNQEVGVDVQQIKPYNEKVVKKCFTEKEKVHFYKIEEAQRDLEFATIWAMKESYLKAIGIGITEKLDGFETEYDEKSGNGNVSYICNTEGKSYPDARIRILKNVQGYALSICCLENVEEVKVRKLEN